MKLFLIICATLLASASLAACGGTTTSGQGQPAPAPRDPVAATLTSNAGNTRKMCAAYFALVNQGWSDDDIYTSLDDAGTFDSYYGQGHAFFRALVKWCYQHD